MKSFNCALIGLGAIHMNHVRAIEALPECKLVAVCDIDAAKAEKKAEELNCNGYTDYKTMLGQEQIDVVHICTPHYLHAPMAIYAMEHGVNVLVEKPMGMNSRETAEMIRVAKETGRRLGVCFQNRYNPTVQRIRTLIDQGDLGRFLSSKTIVSWNRDAAYYAQGAWRGTWNEEGGGVLINQAIHTMDLTQWLAGFPVDVQAQTSCFRLHDAIEVEDTAHGYFHYPDGATGIFYATNAFGADDPVELDLVFENATIRLKKDLLIQYADGTEEHMDDQSLVSGAKGYWGNGHTALIHDYYTCLDEGRPFPIDGPEAAKIIKVLDAIYRSAATGNRICIQGG